MLPARYDDDDDIYIYIYIYMMRERERERREESVYLGNKFYKKTMEHCLLFLIVIFKPSCYFSCVRIQVVKKLSPIFCQL